MKDSDFKAKEILNAFVDDELDAQERQDITNKQLADPELANAICELRVLKDLVRAAKPGNGKQNTHVTVPKRHGFGRWLAVASVLLALFTFIVSVAWSPSSYTDITRHLTPGYENFTDLLQTQSETQLKMILHVTSADPDTTMRLFTHLDQIVELSAQHQRKVRIQVVASAQGVKLLQMQTTAYHDKIKFLTTQHHDMIEFIACRRSLLRQAAVQKQMFTLVPEALMTHSGPELIKRRQTQGWITINV